MFTAHRRHPPVILRDSAPGACERDEGENIWEPTTASKSSEVGASSFAGAANLDGARSCADLICLVSYDSLPPYSRSFLGTVVGSKVAGLEFLLTVPETRCAGPFFLLLPIACGSLAYLLIAWRAERVRSARR